MIAREPLGDATLVRLEHGKANALDLELCRAVSAALAELERERRPIVLTGTGSIFSAGVDLKRLLAEGEPYVRAFLPALSDAFLALFRLPLPVIAAVNGHAIAGGAILAWASDRRVMSRGTGRLGIPELRVGVPFPLVPLEIVRFALAPAAAQEAALLGPTWLPEQALERGAVDELAEPGALLARAAELAGELARVPAEAFGPSKRSLRAPALERIERLRAESDRATEALWQSGAVRAAIRRYVEATLRG